MRKKKITYTPKTAVSFKQICSLPRDNISLSSSCWVSLDVGSLSISRQRVGEMSIESITLSRKEFEKLCDWYNTGED